MGSNSHSTTWLVTGASQGLGLAIVLAALRAGHRVIAGARNPERANKDHPEVVDQGGRWLMLDVTSPDTQEIVKKAVKDEGHIDVVVNNAGYVLVGTLEDISEEELYDAYNTKVFGAFRVLKGVLPSMRKRKSGTVVTMSSAFGIAACPAAVGYNGPNFALEGMGESLAMDLAAVNVRSIIIEPGMFRTNVCAAAIRPKAGMTQDYDATAGASDRYLAHTAANPVEKMPGDPNKLGERVVEFVDGTGMAKGLEKYLRLPLESDGLMVMMKKIKVLQDNYGAMQQVTGSTDFERVVCKEASD